VSPKKMLSRVLERRSRVIRTVLRDAHDRERGAVADEISCGVERSPRGGRAVVGDDDSSRTSCHVLIVRDALFRAVRERPDSRCGQLRSVGTAQNPSPIPVPICTRWPRTSRRPTMPTGLSSSTTGRWWMWCSVMRIAAAWSVVSAEIAIGSAVIH
jgi:hypothetical protein